MGPRLNLPVLAWGSAQASTSLTLAAAAWMVSGLSSSPLVNSLLPALVTLPALLPLIRRPLAGVMLLIATRWLPGWGSLLIFLPMGGLAQASDLAQVRGLFHLGDEPLRWQTLARSGAIGALLGSLAMGLSPRTL